jgi:hypothetical protein
MLQSTPSWSISPIVDGKPQSHLMTPLRPLRRDDLKWTPLEWLNHLARQLYRSCSARHHCQETMEISRRLAAHDKPYARAPSPAGKHLPLFFMSAIRRYRCPPAPAKRKVGLKVLLKPTAMAVSQWIETYSHSSEKRVDCVTRYDLTSYDPSLTCVSLEPSHGTTESNAIMYFIELGVNKRLPWMERALREMERASVASLRSV